MDEPLTDAQDCDIRGQDDQEDRGYRIGSKTQSIAQPLRPDGSPYVLNLNLYMKSDLSP